MFITALVFGAGLVVGAIVAAVVYFFLNKNIETLESDNSALRQELSARQVEATELIRASDCGQKPTILPNVSRSNAKR